MPSIADLIEQHREHIQQRYLEEASRLPSSQGVPAEEILDNLPAYLTVLSALSRGQHADPTHTRRRLEELHIGLRLRLGYTLEDATAEFVLLGRLLSRLWEALPAHQQPTPADTQLLFDELQSAMEHTVTVFTGYSLEDRQTEKRALRRMDALAADLLDPPEPSVPLAERLAALLTVVRESLHADAATVLLADPDGQRLHPTASCGLWRTPPDPRPVPVCSPSFVAELASSSEPVHLPEASTTPLALGEGVRSSGIHSLLGLRMSPRGRLLGVVYLGITEARPLEPRARRLLETLVEHLASIIDRARLLQEVRQATARLRESESRHRLTAPASDTTRTRDGEARTLSWSEERLRLAVEATKLGTWEYDPATKAVHWDERSKALFGLSPEESGDVTYDTFLAALHPEDRERVDRAVQHSLSPTGTGTYQIEYRTVGPRDGQERWVSAHGRAFFDASGRLTRFLGTALDITARVRAREAAEREKNRATTVLESISEAFFAVDRQWRFIYVNREAERLLGHPREALLERDHWEVFPITRGTLLEHHYLRAAAERIPVTFEDQDPKGRWLEVRVFPTSEGGLSVFFQDISERKRLEQFRERLIGIVSHDLRNPLNSIVLTAELLLHREDVPTNLLAAVRRISRSAERMARMITDLLDFTRARMGGGIPLRRRPTELVELVRTTLEELEVMHPGRIVLSHEGGPYLGQWDPDRLAQVVSNLVGNALQHGAADTPVQVALRDHCPEVALTVTNQGTPIPGALLPHIFDPFRRAELAGRQGLGLGLYIVQQILLAHGGSISVSSSAATGTTFTVRLPCEPARS
jgi:PAS domain S-box-containing protein